METILSIISALLGMVSVVLAWFYGTKKRRLNDKIDSLEKKIGRIEKYNEVTGYKIIIHDGFYCLCYAGGIALTATGLKAIIFAILPFDPLIDFSNQFVAGAYTGAGVVLLDTFVLLKKAYDPKASVHHLKSKVDSLKKEANKI